MRNAGADRKTVARLPGREQPRHLSRVVWISAAIGALALHASGVAIAVGAMQPNEDDDDLGAPGIEIGVELTSPRLDPSNQPIGPDTTASMPSPEVVEQKQVEKQTDLPKAAPTETDDPDRTVSPTATQKPVKDDPTPATAQADPSQASVAAEQSEVPTVENAQESPRSVSPSQGTGQSAVRERVTWQKELGAHFKKFLRYPLDRPPQSVEVMVAFVIDRVGHVLSAHVDKSSGDASFDEAALAMLRRADPLPAPPAVQADESLTFTVPVGFTNKHK
jgi:protein TonB